MLTIMVQFVYYFSHISHLSINSFTGVYRQASWFHSKFVCNNLLVTKAEKGRFCRLVTEGVTDWSLGFCDWCFIHLILYSHHDYMLTSCGKWSYIWKTSIDISNKMSSDLTNTFFLPQEISCKCLMIMM